MTNVTEVLSALIDAEEVYGKLYDKLEELFPNHRDGLIDEMVFDYNYAIEKALGVEGDPFAFWDTISDWVSSKDKDRISKEELINKLLDPEQNDYEFVVTTV